MYIKYDVPPATALFFDPATDAGKLIAANTFITPTGDAILDVAGLSGAVILHPSYGDHEIGVGYVIPTEYEEPRPMFDVLSTSFPDGSYLYKVGIIGEIRAVAVYQTMGRVTQFEDLSLETRIHMTYVDASPIDPNNRVLYEEALAFVGPHFLNNLPKDSIRFSDGLAMLKPGEVDSLIAAMRGCPNDAH